MDDLVAAESLAEVQATVYRLLALRSRPEPFLPDPDKARKAREASERRKADASKRKAFEERMVRKARRQGLPLDHYLQQGLANPTFAGIRELKKVPDEAQRMALWRAAHAQHCFNYHFGPQVPFQQTLFIMYSSPLTQPCPSVVCLPACLSLRLLIVCVSITDAYYMSAGLPPRAQLLVPPLRPRRARRRLPVLRVEALRYRSIDRLV